MQSFDNAKAIAKAPRIVTDPQLLLTGARVSELLQAEWCHIDLNRRAWLIPISKTGKSRYVRD